MSNTIGQLVRSARIAAGYPTIYSLSQKTGVATNTIRLIENGEASPSIRTLERIFEAIGWEVVVLIRKGSR